MLWIITDTHLGHYAMIKSCGRPENFDAIICWNWRERVKPQDTVIHLVEEVIRSAGGLFHKIQPQIKKRYPRKCG